MMRQLAGGRCLLLVCLAGLHGGQVLAIPASRALLDTPNPTLALQQPPAASNDDEAGLEKQGRTVAMSGALEDLLDFFGASDSKAQDSDAAAQAGTGGHHRGDHVTSGPSADASHNPRERWVHKAPHLPQAALGEALFNAAVHDGPSTLAESTGMVIATTGNRFNFARLLQKFLAGLKHCLSGDLTIHAVVVGMGKPAKSICEGLNGRYSHQCVQSANWPGHDTEYDAGDAWHVAAELHKLELILNILTLGYSVIYVDVDTVFYRNPMPHLLSLRADVGLPDNHCQATEDNSTSTKDTRLDQDTSLIFAHSGPRAVRFIYDWIAAHKHDMHRLDGLIRHDQVLFNEVLAPHFLRNGAGEKGDAVVRIHQLSQDRFPSWCSGPCGCDGTIKVAPVSFTKQEDATDGIRSGVLECPEMAVDKWMTFHYACTKSGAEKEALMDISLALLEEATPIDMSIVTGV